MPFLEPRTMEDTNFTSNEPISDKVDGLGKKITDKAESLRKQAGSAIENARESYEDAKEMADKSRAFVEDTSAELTKFVRREPLLAMGAAFAVGFFVAQIVKRLP